MNIRRSIGRRVSPLWLIASGMFAYSAILTAMTGDVGFDGDDWWVFSWPYWHDFPGSMFGYAQKFLRPVEGVYWICMFELFGFNRIAFHFASLLLLASSCLLMGKGLTRAFPGRPNLAVLSTIFAFFLPTVACLTYLVFTDNSRISLLIFWASVLAFQSWAVKSSSWFRLVVAVSLYLFSFLTYEASSFLIFVVPLLVWPIHKRNQTVSDGKFVTILAIGIFSGFTGALLLRYVFLQGGVVEKVSLIPSLELFWSYLALLPFYIVAPFTFPPEKSWVVFLGITVAVATTLMMYAAHEKPICKTEIGGDTGYYLFYEKWCPLVLGLGIFFLGMLPYQMAGYGGAPPRIVDTVLAKYGLISDQHPVWFNFNEASRIYSSASYGIAILIASLASIANNTNFRKIAVVAVTIAIGCMATFHAGLSLDWKEVSSIRNQLVTSLVSQAPDVEPSTNFVFVDLELYHKRAAVIRGWAGLRELTRMLYDDPSLGAWYVYPSETAWPNISRQQAIIFPTGFVSRGMDLDRPATPDSILIFRRLGTNMVLLNKLSSKDDFIKTGISWRGCSELDSSPPRIIYQSDSRTTPRRDSRNAWNTGLRSSLGLTVD